MTEKLNIIQWEKQLWGLACELAQGLAKTWLEEVDLSLMKEREAGLVVEGLKERRVVTLFGDVKIRRRLYRDKAGESRFLLDEAVGLEKRSPWSPGVRELSALLATYLPFGKCEQVLRLLMLDGVSHTTVHRQVGKATEQRLVEEEEEREQAFEEGKMPQGGERVVPRLFVEADGVSVALQREEERRGEIKVGIAYEGWEKVERDRYRLKEKTAYLGMMKGEHFWECFSLSLAKKYDLGRVGHIVVGGDGAAWAREGAEFLGGTFQLDRFHLRRSLLRGLEGDVGLSNEVYRACLKGDVAQADSLLVQRQSQVGEEAALEIARLRSYLLDNTCGLVDYRLALSGEEWLRGLGAIEGNVDKLIANRMKKRGMSWTKRGAQRMAKLINLRQRGEILTYIRPTKHVTIRALPEQPTPSGKTKRVGHANAWLQARMPALDGPHANRPWVRALNNLAHHTGTILW